MRLLRSRASAARRRVILATIPARLRSNFRTVDNTALSRFRDVLIDVLFPGTDAEVEDRSRDVWVHLVNRLERVRFEVVPWLDSCMPLRAARVLEVGCGSGSDTVALAEQGADVTAIEVHGPALEVARRRLAMYGLQARLVHGNAADVGDLVPERDFDLVLFTASLEHMTMGERLATLTDGWRMVRDGGLLGIVETPNRLWWVDRHTSQLPFYHWLPDELAFRCSGTSDRPGFGDVYDTLTPESLLAFQRRGRGVSYHELQVAVGLDSNLLVESGKRDFLRTRRPLLGYGIRRRLDRRYLALLRRAAPAAHPALLEEYLDIVVRKGSSGTASS
jgi:2-polyprenyl-3-methyl-5-hydroxy-6-metoxy-1,4-benzoquinol methylase